MEEKEEVLLGVCGECCCGWWGVLEIREWGRSDWAAPCFEKTWMWIGFLFKVISQGSFSYGCW